MNKRTIFTAVIMSVMMLTACNQSKLKTAQEHNVLLEDSLKTALANQDSLLTLLNEISEGMSQIRDMEKILSSGNLMGETTSRKEEIRQQMQSIQLALKDRRERLAQLESKLNQANQNNLTLKRTIENLKAEISQQESTIHSLREELQNAKIVVADLNERVDSLNYTVATERRDKEAAEQHATAVTDELNICYYAVGSKSELKDAKIIETGFLRKTKLMQGDFVQDYFKRGDKRTLSSIPTHASKIKVLTNMPSDSYRIEDGDEGKTLVITDAARFWSLSNYLVIQAD